MNVAIKAALFSLMLNAGLEAQAIEVPVLAGPAQKATAAPPPPLRLAETREPLPMHTLAEASLGAVDALTALNVRNLTGRQPTQNGFARPLPESLRADLSLAAGSDGLMAKRGGGWLAVSLRGNPVWGTSISVAHSHRLRLELRDVDLPPGTRLWVWGETEEPVPFDLSFLGPDRTLWTPSVAGPTLYLEVEAPAAGAAQVPAGFRVQRILELFPLGEGGKALVGPAAGNKEITSCIVDAACIGNGTLSGIATLRKAIAYLEFVSGGETFLCSGSLLNNTRNDLTPYFLTANHCFSTQGEVNTLEAFFDYVDSSCNGSAPGLGSLPRALGGTLLATSASSDFTFLRLSSAPGTRAFLGWNSSASAAPAGTTLYRLSHPLGEPLSYSKSVAWNPPGGACAGAPTAQFLYQDPQPDQSNGATFGGSSGSPVLLATGQVVGQLTGGCGPNADEPCLAGSQDSDFDGRFSSTFPAISSFLSPVLNTGPCVTNATTACLQNGRFEVTVNWQSNSSSGSGQVMSFGGQRAENSDSVFFWFFTSTNFEMGLKILNACGLNNKFWVFISGLTDQGWTVNIRDTTNGATKTYTNALGHLTSTTADTSALSCP